jgi:hypothetical protein
MKKLLGKKTVLSAFSLGTTLGNSSKDAPAVQIREDESGEREGYT